MKESYYINKIKKGDQNALDSFIRELYPEVYTFVYRKVQGDDHAKDITQEVFLRFVRQIPTYHDEGKVLHYLFKIASNVCIDHFGKMKKLRAEDFDDLEYMIDSKENVHESILNQLHQEEVMQFVKSLTLPQQDVILLKYFHQMTFKEIADLYHMPISSIKSRHTRALLKLRKMMKEGDLYVYE